MTIKKYAVDIIAYIAHLNSLKQKIKKSDEKVTYSLTRKADPSRLTIDARKYVIKKRAGKMFYEFEDGEQAFIYHINHIDLFKHENNQLHPKLLMLGETLDNIREITKTLPIATCMARPITVDEENGIRLFKPEKNIARIKIKVPIPPDLTDEKFVILSQSIEILLKENYKWLNIGTIDPFAEIKIGMSPPPDCVTISDRDLALLRLWEGIPQGLRGGLISIGISPLTGKEISIDPYKASNNMFVITGKSGSGKTELSKKILEQMLRQGVTMFIIDFAGQSNESIDGQKIPGIGFNSDPACRTVNLGDSEILNPLAFIYSDIKVLEGTLKNFFYLGGIQIGSMTSFMSWFNLGKDGRVKIDVSDLMGKSVAAEPEDNQGSMDKFMNLCENMIDGDDARNIVDFLQTLKHAGFTFRDNFDGDDLAIHIDLSASDAKGLNTGIYLGYVAANMSPTKSVPRNIGTFIDEFKRLGDKLNQTPCKYIDEKHILSVIHSLISKKIILDTRRNKEPFGIALHTISELKNLPSFMEDLRDQAAIRLDMDPEAAREGTLERVYLSRNSSGGHYVLVTNGDQHKVAQVTLDDGQLFTTIPSFDFNLGAGSAILGSEFLSQKDLLTRKGYSLYQIPHKIGIPPIFVYTGVWNNVELSLAQYILGKVGTKVPGRDLIYTVGKPGTLLILESKKLKSDLPWIRTNREKFKVLFGNQNGSNGNGNSSASEKITNNIKNIPELMMFLRDKVDLMELVNEWPALRPLVQPFLLAPAIEMMVVEKNGPEEALYAV